jgi:hypothetical protein
MRRNSNSAKMELLTSGGKEFNSAEKELLSKYLTNESYKNKKTKNMEWAKIEKDWKNKALMQDDTNDNTNPIRIRSSQQIKKFYFKNKFKYDINIKNNTISISSSVLSLSF